MSIESMYRALGVTPHYIGDDPVISVRNPGYIKFQTLEPEPNTAVVDNAQADEYEAHLKSTSAMYERDGRCFDLGSEATDELRKLCDEHDVQPDAR